MADDQAAIFEHLRASTVRLLGYDDIEHLTAAQEIRLSRAITLRLTIDDLQARQLRGERIDVSAFVEASESLERMVGGQPDKPTEERFGSDARERLRKLIENVMRIGEARDAENEATTALRDEAQAIAAASVDGVERAERMLTAGVGSVADGSIARARDNSGCVDGDARDGDAILPSSASAAPVDAAPSRVETAVERMNRVNATPANPPPGPREPWRSHIDANGEIIAPWFRSHG
jgi:hypothetical protein